MSHFPEWKEHVHTAVQQVKAAEISVKTLQQELIELDNLSTKHDDKLGMIFNSFANFQYSLHKYILTVTKRIELTEASNLGGTETLAGLPEQLILDRKVE